MEPKASVPVRDHAGGHERVGDVRPAEGGARRHMVDHVVPGQRVVLREQGDHPLGPGAAGHPWPW